MGRPLPLEARAPQHHQAALANKGRERTSSRCLADACLADEHSEAAHTCESPVQMRSKRLQFTLAANEDGGRRGGSARAVSNGYSMAAGTAQACLIQIELTTGRTYRCHSSSITRSDQVKERHGPVWALHRETSEAIQLGQKGEAQFEKIGHYKAREVRQ